jgi:hypothetical protein
MKCVKLARIHATAIRWCLAVIIWLTLVAYLLFVSWNYVMVSEEICSLQLRSRPVKDCWGLLENGKRGENDRPAGYAHQQAREDYWKDFGKKAA